MSDMDPGAQRPGYEPPWARPAAEPRHWDPWETGSQYQQPQQQQQQQPRWEQQQPRWEQQQPRWEPSWPPVQGTGYQPGYPGSYPPPGTYPGSYPGGWAGPDDARRRRPPVLRQAATIIMVALVAAGAGAGISYAVAGSRAPTSTAATGPSGSSPQAPIIPPANPGTEPPGAPGGQPPSGGTQTSPPPGAGAPTNVSSIAASVDPGLVDINVEFNQNAGGAGTGIVLTRSGEVVTNNHVIDGAMSVSVTDIGNGRTYGATVVGYDNTHDLAVLQLKGASGLQTASISRSAATVGEAAVAVGNAGGRGGTPTAAGGSVTALSQSITATDSLDGTSEQLTGLIETNADIQSGDSGGSLVNTSGQVIGIDTAALTGSGNEPQQPSTQGYAIPITQAITTARQIESGHGTSVIHVGATAFLGVSFDAPNGGGNGPGGGGFGGAGGGGGIGGGGGFGGGQGSSQPGAVISGVVSGGAAQAAGLQDGDTITALGGRAINTEEDLTKALVRYHPGDKAELGWTDTAGQPHTATVQLGSGPPA